LPAIGFGTFIKLYVARRPVQCQTNNMKRLPAFLLFLFILPALALRSATIYVAINGSDSNTGTREQPLATIAAALRKARDLRRLQDPSITAGIYIIVSGAVYQLHEPLFIRPEDAGTAASPTVIESAPNEKVILSGGVTINHWQKPKKNIPGLPAIAQGKVWMADLPFSNSYPYSFRQLWVNDIKATPAKSTNGGKMDRILSWNKKEQTCWIPTPRFPGLQNAQAMEMLIHQWWAIANLRIKKIETKGDSTKLYFYQPESRIQSQHPWPAPWISAETGNSPFYLTNAIQFLDEPGEWWLDVAGHTLYYWPRKNENLQSDTVTAPLLETLVIIQGTAEKPVSNVFFKNISFEHTGWLRPSTAGHVALQAGMYLLDAYKLTVPGTAEKKTLENQAWVGRPAAAVRASYADSTGFDYCRFEHLAASGLDYSKYTHHNTVNGNLFKDIGGTAVLAGVFSDEATEVHIPYNPSDDREVCSDMLISNNLITNVTNEDWGCVGIGAGYTRNIKIIHNEICDLSYTAISMGWGWTKADNAMRNNEISFNKIHHYGKHNYDCAGVYTLSAQPGSVISNNYIDSIYKAPYAHLPFHWFYLYTDEGSSFITVKDNWCPSEKFLQNANGPGNTWVNNGPQAGSKIKALAGIDPPYQQFSAERSVDKGITINSEHPVIIELETATGESVDTTRLKEILLQYNSGLSAVYQWKQHFVIFDRVTDAYSLQQKLKSVFPGVQVKTFDNLFYDFNRSRCGDTNVALAWEHNILTANLVPDPRLQKKYLEYHATQFEKWPEVAQGFCNAGFQQLLVYKNGRQLMLVISTPKGKSLDELNPKTTESNPRMAEWNKLMQRFQEGIPGAGKRVWVSFHKLGSLSE
jgi:hypothetical protein